MKTLFKTMFLLLVAFILSCEKDYIFTQLTDGVLLKEVYVGDSLSYVYTYNNAKQILEKKGKWSYTKYNYRNNRLVSSDLYFDNRIVSSSSYILNKALNRKDWVNPENTEREFTIEYSYKGDQLVKSTLNYGYSIYNYDENNRISRQILFEDDGKESGYTDFSYDAKGNMVKRLRYSVSSDGKATLETTTLYEFDDKKNPYRAFSSLVLPGENTNVNNIVKETYMLHFEVDDFIRKVQVTENTYEYDSEGYPITKNNVVRFIYY